MRILQSEMVRLILRDREYEVRPGMTLQAALQKGGVLPEAVIATRDGELILEDEILRDDDEIRLIAVISGGSQVADTFRRRGPALADCVRRGRGRAK